VTAIVTLADGSQPLPEAMSKLRSRTVTAQKLRGLYRRGNTFWFAHQKEGRRRWISLETNDQRLAQTRVNDLRTALDRDDPLPAWRRMYVKKGVYWVHFHVCLNTAEVNEAVAKADRINAAIQASNP